MPGREKLGPIFNATASITNGSGDDGKGTNWGTTFRDPTTAWLSGGDWWTAQACMNGTCLSKAAAAVAAAESQASVAATVTAAAAGAGSRSSASSRKLQLQDAEWTSAGWFHRVEDSGARNHCESCICFPANFLPLIGPEPVLANHLFRHHEFRHKKRACFLIFSVCLQGRGSARTSLRSRQLQRRMDLVVTRRTRRKRLVSF